MTSSVVAGLVLVCTFCGALGGIFLNARLPAGHRDADSRDVVRLVMGLVTSVAALVLGLLISSAHSSLNAQSAEVQQLAIRMVQLDRTLAHLGQDAADARGLLRRVVLAEMQRIWPPDGVPAANHEAFQVESLAEELLDRIADMSPKTDAQRFDQTRALQILASMGDTRRLLGEQARGSLSWPFLVVLVFWLTVLFVGFGLFGRFNATVVTALLVGALSAAGAIFLMLEMNRPYGGMMQISSAPIRDALSQMGR